MTSAALRFNKKSDKDGTGKCNIVNGGDGVHVAVYEIDLVQKVVLDRIEGLGYGYREKIINVAGHGNCWTYVADEEAIDDSLEPVDWYKEMVILGCRYHDFPVGYLNQIEVIPASLDSDESRSREEWNLVKILRNGT